MDTDQQFPAIIDLWPSGAWSLEDEEDLKNCFDKASKTQLQRSDDVRGMELHLTIAFLAGGVAAGFLNAIGTDIYNRLKAILKRKWNKEHDVAVLLSIDGQVTEGKIGKISFLGLTDGSSSYEAFTEDLEYILECSRALIVESRGIFRGGNHYTIGGEWNFYLQENWKLVVREWKLEADGKLHPVASYVGNLEGRFVGNYDEKTIEHLTKQ